MHEKDIIELEYEDSQRLMMVTLPILIQKIVKKAYPSIGKRELLLSELENSLKHIAITEIESAIDTCKKM